MNFVNPGLEHPWRISIDDHELWIVANDGGFVHPQKVNVGRISISIQLNTN